MSGWNAGRASCRDHIDVFDAAATGSKKATDQARLVCYGCPVFKACESESLTFREPDGMWAAEMPVQRFATAVFLGMPRQVRPSTMEAFDWRVALADALDDAAADGRPLWPVFEAAGVSKNEMSGWRSRFDTRLSGADPNAIRGRMKAS